MSDYISHDHEHDGIDRRGFLKCMAWAGTGVLWTVSGGVLASKTLAEIAKTGTPLPATDLSFLQISDSHIGFNKDANKDVTETFKIALDRINAMPTPPSFLIHTGDITQLSKPEEFDTFDQVLKSCRTKDVLYVPGVDHSCAVRRRQCHPVPFIDAFKRSQPTRRFIRGCPPGLLSRIPGGRDRLAQSKCRLKG